MKSSLPEAAAPACQFENGSLLPRYDDSTATPESWRQAMRAAFGTDNADTIGYLVQCLGKVQPKDEQFLNACLEGLHDLRPRDHTERLLIIQMMAVHHRAIETLSEAYRKPFDRERLERHAARLMKLFAQQAETLKRYRRDATQVVNVNHMVVDKALIGCDIPQQGGSQI